MEIFSHEEQESPETLLHLLFYLLKNNPVNPVNPV